jgi:hypothetical protein
MVDSLRMFAICSMQNHIDRLGVVAAVHIWCKVLTTSQYGGYLSKMFSVRCLSNASRSPRQIGRRLEPLSSRCAVSVRDFG